MKKSTKAPGGVPRRRNLPLMLLQAREVLLQHFRPIFQDFGLTEQQWRILRVLNDHERLEQHEITSLCQISGPSLSNILSRLEATGYVTRERGREDHRKVFVTLAKSGLTLVGEVANHVDARYREIEKALGADLMSALFVVLDRLLAQGRDAIDERTKGSKGENVPTGRNSDLLS
ncbi:homoprotocatechuate degradation operon regulator HpaR [Bradyrhizobium sp.]|uniref:homoprotocatechuate degradation operon regulator HpaR n=1 Tax=Bradyrhizobium sp. TaxID=376 RepID=UPI001E0DCC94|nr:homoprotocatechuate degradation operon regulator HpaR [Bradyrhizobium sp.]MBI5321823.1 homoprotocatechuate degradation operon regulator HpaR [Bradyrhizobium sp.]